MSQPRKFNCLVVDDEPPARDVLRRYIQQVPMLEFSGECSNAIQALTALKQQSVDLLFLDIQMPQISGLDMIRTIAHPPKIVLTTAFEQYAVQAFELDVTDYLLKPVQFDRFLKAVMKAIPSQQEAGIPVIPTSVAESHTPSFLYFRADRKMVKVFLDDILFIESMKDYVKLVTINETIITKHAITALEVMLPASMFIRVHRSFIVALSKVHSFTQEEINIQQTSIPIGKIFRQQVQKMLMSNKD